MQRVALIVVVFLCIAAGAAAQKIPGLMPVDVYLNCQKKGFAVEKKFDGEQKEWRCTKTVGEAKYVAECFSSDVQSVEVIRGTSSFTGDGDGHQFAAEFLGWLATLPYEGAQPAEAKKWVTDNIGTDASTVIGDVKFELMGTKKTIILRMSAK